MVHLYSVDKYYDIIFNGEEYNLLLKSSNFIVDQVKIFKNGERIAQTEESEKVLDYFYDNIEAE